METQVKQVEPAKTAVTTQQPKAVNTAAPIPTIVEQKYLIIVNPRKGSYHPLPKELREDTGKIESQFKMVDGQSTTAIIRGLSTLQERLFATDLINKNPKDPNFDEAMTLYWADFSVEVKEKKGLTLDASYRLEKRVIDGNEYEVEVPVNLFQYIKANFAKQSSRVAFREEDVANSYLFDFIMNDLSEVKKAETQLFKIRNRAGAYYSELIANYNQGLPNEKIEYLVEILKEPRENFASASIEDKLIFLETKKNNNPEAFIATFTDKNLEAKALLYQAARAGIITIEGNTYFYIDENMGVEAEAINFINDATKSGYVSKIKAGLQKR